MTARVTSVSWTDEEIDRLRELSTKNASVVRAAAALNRTTSSVKRTARMHNIPLVGVRQSKAAVRALDSKAPFSTH